MNLFFKIIIVIFKIIKKFLLVIFYSIGQIVLNIFNFGQLLHFFIRLDRLEKNNNKELI